MPALPDTRRTVTRGGARRRTLTGVTALAGLVGLLLSGCTSGSAAPTAGAGAPAPRTAPAPGSPTSSDSSPYLLVPPDHVLVVVFENEDAEASAPERPTSPRSPRPGRSSPTRTARPTPASPTTSRCSPGPPRASRTTAARGFSARQPGRPAARGRARLRRLLRGAARGRLHRVPQRRLRPQAQPVGGLHQPAGRGEPAVHRVPDRLHQLPTVAFVVPDLCNDMHDCGSRPATRGRRKHLGAYASWAKPTTACWSSPSTRTTADGQPHPHRPRRAAVRAGRSDSGSTTTTCCAPSRTCTAWSSRGATRRPPSEIARGLGSPDPWDGPRVVPGVGLCACSGARALRPGADGGTDRSVAPGAVHRGRVHRHRSGSGRAW